jgi:hypothetical protein
MTAEAQKQGAAGVVGVSIAHKIEQREAGGRRDLVVTFHVLGTAIGDRGNNGRELEVSPRIDLSRDALKPHLLGGAR